MKNFQAIIFDWDGTLADSTVHIVRSVQYAFENNGLPIPNDEDARSIIGLSLEQALQRFHLSGEVSLQRLIDDYRAYYFRQDNPIVLFDDALPLLQRLQSHYILGIATGKSRRGLERALDDTGVRNYFSATRTADECASKPHPEMILSLCEEWGIAPQQTLMIGDTTHDLLTAHNACATAIGICCGAMNRNELATAPNDGIFDNLSEVLAYLNFQAA
ncbi:MAG: HAD-IA family hydrolase [Neisseriaceae bacterium]|nr:HAD-IA family hydrolase [Neisseriaceae bacterium]MBQ9724615.1 HAD-IA family hydrolase [Neisseriaceae bacterium]